MVTVGESKLDTGYSSVGARMQGDGAYYSDVLLSQLLLPAIRHVSSQFI